MSTVGASLFSRSELNINNIKLNLESVKGANSTVDNLSPRDDDVKITIDRDQSKSAKMFDKSMFTFKPKLNPKSNLLAQNFLNFYERQNIHTQKQLEILEEAYKMSMNSYGKALTSNSFDRGSANFRYRSAKMSLSRLSSTKLVEEDEDPHSKDQEAGVDIEFNESERINRFNSASKLTNYKRSNFPLLRSHSQLEAKHVKPDLLIHKANNLKPDINPFNKLPKKVNFTPIPNHDAEENEESFESGKQEPKDNSVKIINDTCGDELVVSEVVKVQKVRVKKKKRQIQAAKIVTDEDEERDICSNLVSMSTTSVPDKTPNNVLVRSNTMPVQSAETKRRESLPFKSTNINTERLKMAKEEAEKAIKSKKIFTLVGPYPALRKALKSRGWVEKFENMNSLPALRKRTKEKETKKKVIVETENDETKDLDDAIGDDGNDVLDEDEYEEKLKPWDESNGYFGILSRCVRNYPASLVWTVRNIDYNLINKDTFLNHFNKNGAFTTKIGLCTNLKNLAWYNPQNADEFFPRCFKLGQEEERVAFIDDYRLTCCVSLLKYIMLKHHGQPDDDEPDVHITSAEEMKKMNLVACDQETNGDMIEGVSAGTIEPVKAQTQPVKGNPNRSKKSKLSSVPLDAIDFAIDRIQEYIDFRENDDIDKASEISPSNMEEKWEKFHEWFYAACHDKVPVESLSESLMNEINIVLNLVKTVWPQYKIDGYRNIWIVKPGALSRGRGIVVFDKLENILDFNTHPMQKDGRYVVQKYIERPLLIHKIKFDIRQWFLVTDFNPLTIWMYKDCYLRFCTQKFSLDNTQNSVHLSNYSIQKNFKNEIDRHSDLPDENMWTQQEFIEKHLAPMNKQNAWEEIIYAQMKNAIVCSMQSSQDIIENRKNTFELYGADFMIGTEDLKPWLIEINCSPTMARSTEITTLLCDNVQEDIIKVVVDRKNSRNADTGKFELIFKAPPVTVPNYIGIDLKVDGHSYKKNNHVSVQQQEKKLEPKQEISLEFIKESVNETKEHKNDQISKDSKETKNLLSEPKETFLKFEKQNNQFDKLDKVEKVLTSHLTNSTTKLVDNVVNTINTDKNRTPSLPAVSSLNEKKTPNYSKPKRELTCAPISIATSIHELTQKEQQNQTHLANYQLLTSSQTKINSTNLSSINYSYLLNNNTTSSTQASLQEKLKDINSSDLLLNARRRVHLNEEVQKEFKTSLPREPKVFHFHPVHNQGAAISNFKSTPHLASSIILDNQNHNSIQHHSNHGHGQSHGRHQNKVKGANKQKLLLKTIQSFKDRADRDRVEVINQFYSSDNNSFVTLNNVKNSYIADLNELKSLKKDSSKSLKDYDEYKSLPDISEVKTASVDALKNKTPRNYLLEHKNTTKKEVITMEKPSISAYQIGIADHNITKLMKKYSIS